MGDHPSIIFGRDTGAEMKPLTGFWRDAQNYSLWAKTELRGDPSMTDASFIIWIQQYANPVIDAFFKAVTFLGNEEYYILSIPLFFWLYDKRFAMRFGLFFLLNAYINSFIKHIFKVPRPPLKLHKIEQGGYSFPSGHAQGNTSFWGYLAVQVRKPWAYIVAAVLICLVAFSRVYLGVHFPHDIIVGVLIGIAWIAIYEFLARRIKWQLTRLQWFLVSLGLCAVLLAIHPTGDGPLTMGFMLGALWGYRLEKDFVGFSEKGNWWRNILKAAIGLAGLFALRMGLKPVLLLAFGHPEEGTALYHAATFLRYFLIGLWVTLAAPWVFRLIGLEVREIADETPQSVEA
jgi:membrane-associated phospholipid phosphatase